MKIVRLRACGPKRRGQDNRHKDPHEIFSVATRGRAEVLGLESTRLRGRYFSSIGYVSENQELPEWMRLDSFLAYLRPFYSSWDRKLENELVSQFDLPLDRRLRNLSRGMRMKAALTSALAYHPKLIVLDEPFTGLDPLVRDELIQGLLERAEESTILISSHDLAEIESFASHIGYLEQGQLRFSEEWTTWWSVSERWN
jgi:ABC-2 type transport system ATP-binding protein